MTFKKKDRNQKEIEQHLKQVGALWIDCTGDPNIGFDGIVAYRGKLYIVEAKDGKKPPSQRQLTDGEKRRKEQVECAGVQYNVIESTEQMLQLIGATE